MSDSDPVSAADKIEIHELLARYAWAYNTADVEGFVGCFAQDATMREDVFEEEDRWFGHDEIRSMAEHFFSIPGFAGRQHHANQIVIEGSSRRCNVRAYCIVVEPRDGEPCAIPFAGYYNDVVVKVGGRWLFQERIVRHWSGPVLRNFAGQDGVKVPRKRPPH